MKIKKEIYLILITILISIIACSNDPSQKKKSKFNTILEVTPIATQPLPPN